MTTQHTPTHDSIQADEFMAELHEEFEFRSAPWAIANDGEETSSYVVSIDVPGYEERDHYAVDVRSGDPEENVAMAAFIVRACNAHDELVAALRETVDELSAYECSQFQLDLIERARAALARVK